MDRAISVLGKSRLFADVRPDDLALIAGACEQRMIVEGEDLFLEGESGDSLWLVLDGRVEVFKRIRGDVDRVLSVLGPGDALGEISFIDGSPRSAGVRTLVSSEFLVLTREAFARVQRERPEAAAAFYQNVSSIMAGRLRHVNELYRDSVEFGLDAVGAATLNLKSISEELRAVSVHLSGGASVSGRLVQIDHHAAGYALILKGTDEKMRLVPYHAVQWIELA